MLTLLLGDRKDNSSKTLCSLKRQTTNPGKQGLKWSCALELVRYKQQMQRYWYMMVPTITNLTHILTQHSVNKAQLLQRDCAMHYVS